MKQDERLLTPEEREPYLAVAKCQIIDDFAGVYDHEYEVWNIDKLLKAQLAKVHQQGWRSPEEIKVLLQDEHDQHINGEEEAKREERERIFRDIDNMGLIGEHTDSSLHKTGATILDCPACCWYAYRAKEEK